MVASASLLALAMVNVLLFTLFRTNSELKPEQASFGAESGHKKPIKNGTWSVIWYNDLSPSAWTKICISYDGISSTGKTVYLLNEAGNQGVRPTKMFQNQNGTLHIDKTQIGGLGNVPCVGHPRKNQRTILWYTSYPMQYRAIYMEWTFITDLPCPQYPPKKLPTGIWNNDNAHGPKAFPWKQICISLNSSESASTFYSLKSVDNPGSKAELMQQNKDGSLFINTHMSGMITDYDGTYNDVDVIISWHARDSPTDPSYQMTWTFKGPSCA